jgi:RNA polymerase sigma factor (sigma-70 family)
MVVSRFPVFIDGGVFFPKMNESAIAEHPDPFAEEDLATIIEWLDLGDGEEWQAAARSLYQRYSEWLFRRLYAPLRDSGHLEDIVQETFRKVIRNSAKFQRKEAEDPDDTKAKFEAWMLKIAKRLMLDHFRKHHHTVTRDAEFWDRVAVDASEPMVEAPPSPVVDAVYEVLAEFTDREQTILRAYMQHCTDMANPQSKFPRDVLQELSDSLNTTKTNIRTIKSRALKCFKEKLADRGIHL